MSQANMNNLSNEEISFKIDWTPEQKKAFKDITGFTELDNDYIKIEQLLKLVEKQQKEIEEYKETINALKPNLEELIKMSNFAMQKDYVSKDKIREKIQDLKEIISRMDIEDIGRMLREEQILILEEILEENNNETKKL